MRKFEREYDITDTTALVKSERTFRRDVDLRLDNLEQRDQVIDTAAREVVDRAIRYIQQELSPKAAEIELLLASFREGVPANLVVEEQNGRQFLTPDRRAEILAAALAEIASAINALKGGVGTAYDTLQEIAAWIANDETAEVALTAALANRVRFDTMQALTGPQLAQAWTNLGMVIATAAAIRTNTAGGFLTTDQVWASAAWVPLGDVTGNVTLDLNAGSHFTATLIGNVTLSYQNAKPGQPFGVIFTQDVTGNRTISYASGKFLFLPNNTLPSIGTVGGALALVLSGKIGPDATQNALTVGMKA